MMKLEFSQHTPRKSSLGGPAKARPRPLGSVRVSSSIDTIPKFPPLVKEKIADKNARLQGISGKGMAVPRPRPTQVKADIPDARVESRTSQRSSIVLAPSTPQQRVIASSPSARSACTCNRGAELLNREQQITELRNREREHEDMTAKLEQLIEELREIVRSRDSSIEDLKAECERQEQHYKELYTQECVQHESTRQKLQEVSFKLEQQVALLEEQRGHHEENMRTLTAQMESKLAAERQEKENEIKMRDEKLGKLKKQIAEALKGNSWERQQQLDELSKELQRVQEESEMLKMRLKAVSKGATSSRGAATNRDSGKSADCSNCDALSKQLGTAQAGIAERDTYILELKKLCATFENQLGQQDSLLTQFAQSKGYKAADGSKKKA